MWNLKKIQRLSLYFLSSSLASINTIFFTETSSSGWSLIRFSVTRWSACTQNSEPRKFSRVWIISVYTTVYNVVYAWCTLRCTLWCTRYTLQYTCIHRCTFGVLPQYTYIFYSVHPTVRYGVDLSVRYIVHYGVRNVVHYSVRYFVHYSVCYVVHPSVCYVVHPSVCSRV